MPVKRTIRTVRQFKDEHVSYYKQTHGGLGLKAQRVALGLPPMDHDGGEQPKKQIHLDDTKFVSGLINSGIPLDIMDPAFDGTSPFRINKMFALFWEVPEVGPNLKRLSDGQEHAH